MPRRARQWGGDSSEGCRDLGVLRRRPPKSHILKCAVTAPPRRVTSRRLRARLRGDALELVASRRPPRCPPSASRRASRRPRRARILVPAAGCRATLVPRPRARPRGVLRRDGHGRVAVHVRSRWRHPRKLEPRRRALRREQDGPARVRRPAVQGVRRPRRRRRARRPRRPRHHPRRRLHTRARRVHREDPRRATPRRRARRRRRRRGQDLRRPPRQRRRSRRRRRRGVPARRRRTSAGREDV